MQVVKNKPAPPYKIAEFDGGVRCVQLVKNKCAPSYKIAECDGGVRLCS